MPAKTTKQRKKMCIALSIKEGKTPASYSKECADIARNTSKAALEEYCKSPVAEG